VGSVRANDAQRRSFVQQDPATRISAPAIGLMVAGGLSLAFTLFYILLVSVIGVAAIADKQTADALPGVGIMIGAAVVKLALDALTLYGAWQMRQLRNWGLSMTAAICAMLPCSVCCLLGLPLGIWAVVVLIDRDIKQAFDGGPAGGYGGPGGYGSDYPPQA
jgi:hypothetical protein